MTSMWNKALRGLVIRWVLIIVALGLASLYPSIISWIIVSLWIGVMQYHLNILGHEGIHYLVCPGNKVLNDFVTCWFILYPQLAPLQNVRQNHWNHHRHVGTNLDFDRHYYEGSHCHSRFRLFLWILASLTGGMVFPLGIKLIFQHKNSQKVSENSFVSLKQWGEMFFVVLWQILWIGFLWALTGFWWAYLLLWLLPILTIMTGLNSIRSFCEHVRLKETPGYLFSFISNPVERFFLAPFNMNYHAEHHLHSHVPYRELSFYRKEGHFVLVSSYWKKIKMVWTQMGFESTR